MSVASYLVKEFIQGQFLSGCVACAQEQSSIFAIIAIIATARSMGNFQAHQKERRAQEGMDMESVTISRLPEISQAIYSGDPKQELLGCQMAGKLVDPFSWLRIGDIGDAILPKCMELLACSNLETRLEAAWIVSNLAREYPDTSQQIIASGTIDWLTQLLHPDPDKHESDVIILKAVRALANLTLEHRGAIIQAGAVPHLVSLAMSLKTPAPLLCKLAHTLGSISNGTEPSLEVIRQILPALVRLVHLDDKDVVNEACWALWELSDCYEARLARLQEVLGTGVTCRLIQLLSSSNSETVNGCLQIIRNLLDEELDQMDRVLDAGPLIQMLGSVLESPDTENVKEAAWIVYLISGGTVGEINTIINGGLVPVLIRVIQNGATDEIKKKAFHAVTTLSDTSNPDFPDCTSYLCQSGLIPALCSALNWKDNEEVKQALKTLSEVLDSAAGVMIDKYRKMVEKCGGLDTLDKLQDDHENPEGVGDDSEIYKLACTVVDKHFQENPSVNDSCSKPAKMQKLDI